MANDALLGWTIPVPRRRFLPPVNEHGYWQDPEVADEVEIMAHVQPADADTLESLPDGQRSYEGIKLYSELDADLETVNEKTGEPADHVQYDGQWWKVVRVERHKEGLLDHLRAVPPRVTVGRAP